MTIKKQDNPIRKPRYRSPNGESRPYRDGNRWKFSLRVELPDGTKNRVTGSGLTQSIAISNAQKLAERRINDWNTSNLHLTSLSEYVVHWIENVKSLESIKYRTLVGYRSAIRNHVAPYFESVRVDELTREHLQKHYALLAKQGYQRSTLKEVRAVLIGALDEAVLSGLCSANCARTVPIPSKKKSSPDFFTVDQVQRILSTAKVRGESLRWALAFHTGMRQGEQLALRWSDIDLDDEKPVINIRGTLLRKKSQGLVIESPKTESSLRQIPLTTEMVTLFKEHRAGQNRMRLKSGSNWRNQDFVFTTPNGTPVDPANDRKAWIKLLADAGIGYKRLHVARHTTATLMHSAGVDLLSISHVLGHSSIGITAEFYAHVPIDTKIKALSTLENLIKF